MVNIQICVAVELEIAAMRLRSFRWPSKADCDEIVFLRIVLFAELKSIAEQTKLSERL